MKSLLSVGFSIEKLSLLINQQSNTSYQDKKKLIVKSSKLKTTRSG